jgi:hypothetical protein
MTTGVKHFFIICWDLVHGKNIHFAARFQPEMFQFFQLCFIPGWKVTLMFQIVLYLPPEEKPVADLNDPLSPSYSQ